MQNQKGFTMQNQKGFTMIELIIVIVIIGLLAVVAIPKYVDMKTEAAKAQADGVYAAAQAATAVNFAGNLVGKGNPLITTGATLLGAMDSPPAGWTAADMTITASLNGDPYTITVTAIETGSTKAALSKSW